MPEDATVSTINIIDDDFEQAAKYLSTSPFGTSKDNILKTLKEQYNRFQILNPLVMLFARYRIKYSTLAQPPVKCTCLSSLEDDAYDPGGPMSGHKRPPPCELHRGS